MKSKFNGNVINICYGFVVGCFSPSFIDSIKKNLRTILLLLFYFWLTSHKIPYKLPSKLHFFTGYSLKENLISIDFFCCYILNLYVMCICVCVYAWVSLCMLLQRLNFTFFLNFASIYSIYVLCCASYSFNSIWIDITLNYLLRLNQRNLLMSIVFRKWLEMPTTLSVKL